MKKYKKFFRLLKVVCFVSLLVANGLFAYEVNRYLPMLNQHYTHGVNKKSELQVSLFYDNASTAHKPCGGRMGLFDLSGQYNLKDVIASVQSVNPTFDPIFQVTRSHALNGQNINFRVNGRMHVFGMNLHCEKELFDKHWIIGASLPMLKLKTTSQFTFIKEGSALQFNQKDSTPQMFFNDELLVDSIRRMTHQQLQFVSNEWSKGGFGDTSIYVGNRQYWEYVLFMKSIKMDMHLGMSLPSGILTDNQYFTSLASGNNGHTGIFGEFSCIFELKYDFTVAWEFRYIHLFKHSRIQRIAFANEPNIFSMLLARVTTKPGETLTISPYIVLGNLTNGLDFLVRYTYLRHGIDKISNVIGDQSALSYVNKDDSVVKNKEKITRWRAHFVSLQVMYRLQKGGKMRSHTPEWFMEWDMPVDGRGFAKTNQLTMGTRLQF